MNDDAPSLPIESGTTLVRVLAPVVALMVLVAIGVGVTVLGPSSNNDGVELQPYAIVTVEDLPAKVGFNKQDALLGLSFRSTGGPSMAWEDLTITLTVLDDADEVLLEEERCLPPQLGEAVESGGVGAADVRINEIVASNDNGLQDEHGDYDDWLELYNPGASEMDLSGWSLTDAYEEYMAGGKTGFTFGSGTTVPPGGYLIVWADGEAAEGDLHTNFRLKSEGEMLTLLDPQNDVHQNVTWGALSSSVSYAAVPDGSINFQVDQTPTPSRTNGVLSGEDINPESAPGSMGTGCIVVQDDEDDVWMFNEPVRLMEDGVDLCGTGASFPVCYIQLAITHRDMVVLHETATIGIT